MEIVIDIPEKEYKCVQITGHIGNTTQVSNAIYNSTPLPKGRWIRITNGAMKEKYICSVCHRMIEDSSVYNLIPVKYPYCHCGAKMEVEE